MRGYIEMSGNKNSGGSRTGAGRKQKPLSEKILNGNPGRRPIKVVDFGNLDEIKGTKMPKPKAYMLANQKQGELLATEIRKEVFEWLALRKCDHLVPMFLIDQYSQGYARWIQAEAARSEYGPLSKNPHTGLPQTSPFVAMALNESKQCMNIWAHIYGIVKENCSTEFGYGVDPNDPMEILLSGRLPRDGRRN